MPVGPDTAGSGAEREDPKNEQLEYFRSVRPKKFSLLIRTFGSMTPTTRCESLSDITCADFLSEAGLRTPVFVRFSTVQGPRGSADTVRDVRGFATKFYTREGAAAVRVDEAVRVHAEALHHPQAARDAGCCRPGSFGA
ncbi:hypothetical protein GCM10009839_17810 [Catenulispora yoronensis]|uniref:catalase n=1 Tax=Catenulispora yoronensis TaxID=450799 RepID=A0ABP5FCN9_9ACTN